MTIARRGWKIDEGFANDFSEKGHAEKKNYKTGSRKLETLRKDKKKALVVIGMLFVMLAASLVVLTYKPYHVASNGFVLGEPVPYEKSYNPNLIKNAKFLGYIDEDQRIGIVIVFKWRNEAQLNEFLREVNDPSSPKYKHFMTWEEFRKNFAPPADMYNAMVEWVQDRGVHIEHTWAMRNSISIVDTAQHIEKAFNTKIGIFEGDGIHTEKYFYAVMEPLQLPSNIIPYLDGVSGTDNSRVYHLNFYTNATTGTRYVFASDLQKMYHVVQLYNNSATAAPISHPIFAKGLRAATVLWEGSTSSYGGSESPPFNPVNIYHYWQHVIPSWEQKAGGMSHVWGYGTESDCVAPGSDTDQTNAFVENELDLEMIGTLAPGIDVVCVYSDSSKTNFPTDNYNYILSTLAHNSTLVAVSNSWGDGDNSVDSGTMNDVKALNALGVTVLAASGDDGDTTSPSEPSTAALDNYGFIAVGGTSPRPNGVDSSNKDFNNTPYETMGNNTDLSNPRSDEIVWYDSKDTNSLTGDHYGTQSGVSSTYSEPSWQKNYIGSYSGRVTADISAVGNRTIIFTSFYSSQSSSFYHHVWIGLGGTSVACPVVAGELAAMAAYAGRYYDGEGSVTGDSSIYGFGFFAPTIYKIGYDYYHNNMYQSSPPFFDVVSGSTVGGGSAQTGWDQVTGWGVINAWEFIHDIGPYMSPVQSSQTVTAGQSTTYEIKIWFPYDWTSEMGHFQVEGLPSGASFTTDVNYVHPAGDGALAWVNFTITTSTSTPAGTYTLTILAYTYNHTSNNWGNLSASTQVTLDVNNGVPEFSTPLLLPILMLFVGLMAVWRRRRIG